MRLLLHSNPGRTAAENIAASGISLQCRDRLGSAREQVDALLHRHVVAYRSSTNLPADHQLAEGGQGDADGQGTSHEGVLFPIEIPGARRRSAAYRCRGAVLRG